MEFQVLQCESDLQFALVLSEDTGRFIERATFPQLSRLLPQINGNATATNLPSDLLVDLFSRPHPRTCVCEIICIAAICTINSTQNTGKVILLLHCDGNDDAITPSSRNRRYHQRGDRKKLIRYVYLSGTSHIRTRKLHFLRNYKLKCHLYFSSLSIHKVI